MHNHSIFNLNGDWTKEVNLVTYGQNGKEDPAS